MFLLCKPAYTEEEIIALQIFTNTHQVLLVAGGMDDLVNWGTLSSTEVGLQKSTADSFLHPDCLLHWWLQIGLEGGGERQASSAKKSTASCNG